MWDSSRWTWYVVSYCTQRERERERERECVCVCVCVCVRERERERDMYMYIHSTSALYSRKRVRRERVKRIENTIG